MATKKVIKLDITQQGGIVKVSHNGELEYSIDCVRYIQRIKEDKVTPQSMANFIAEIINDCLNCKTASAALHDLDELGQYSTDTYFGDLDYRAENDLI